MSKTDDCLIDMHNKELIIKEIFGRGKELKYLTLKWEYQALCNYGETPEADTLAHNEIMHFIKKGLLKEKEGRIIELKRK